MTLLQLDHEQKLALVALMELFALADGSVSESEESQINQVADTLGDDAYRELLDEAESRFADIDMLKGLLLTIKERGARELIYGMVMEEVMSSPSPVQSPDLLDWLKDEWDIEVSDA
jgi:hypothetical protein